MNQEIFTRLSRKFLSIWVLALAVLVCSNGSVRAANSFGVVGLLNFKGSTLKQAHQMVKEADILWHRDSLRWAQVVDDEGIFHWQKTDKKMKKILRGRIKAILTLKSFHRVFAPDSKKVDLGYKTVWKSAPPKLEYLEDYKDFIRQTVERYDGDGVLDADFITDRKNVKYWQIENEPGKNPSRGSDFWKGTAADYAHLYQTAYDAIKEADPEAMVALSGFSWDAMKYYLNHGTSFPSEVLRILWEEGGDFDIFDYHFYEDYKKFKKINNLIHSHLDINPLFAQKPIWITEANVDWRKIPPYLPQDEFDAFVAEDAVRRFSTLFHKKVKKVFWCQVSDQDDAVWQAPMMPYDFIRFRGLLDQNLDPKPVYYTYKLLIEKTKGKKPIKKQKFPDNNDVYIYMFGLGDEAVYIMWYDNPDAIDSGVLEIPVPWQEVLITLPITETGMLTPETELVFSIGGNLQIILTDTPIFIEKY